MAPIFEIHLEDWNDALHIESNGHTSYGYFVSLLSLLTEFNIKAVIYKLEKFDFTSDVHQVKSHGVYHRSWENADRRPYQWLGLTGGFWFRLFPVWFIKRQVIKNGIFYIHPHDLDEDHPKLKNPILNWKRHIGLKGARKKLERLLKEIKWDEANLLTKN